MAIGAPLGGYKIPEKPYNTPRTVVLLGDSITDRCKMQQNTTQVYVQNTGYWYWASMESRGRLRVLNIASETGAGVITKGSGVNGQYVQDYIPTQVLPFSPGYVIVMAGINDANAATTSVNDTWAGSVYANRMWSVYQEKIIEPLLANGITPILCTLTAADTLNTSAERYNTWFFFNQELREYGVINPSVIIADCANNTWLDQTNASGTLFANPLDDFTTDGLHPGGLGGMTLGKYIGSVIAANVPETTVTGVSISDPFNIAQPLTVAVLGSSQFDASSVTSSPNATYFTGTPTPTGDLPVGWIVQGAFSSGTGVTIVASVEAATDFGKNSDWVQFVITDDGSAVQTNPRLVFSGQIATLSARNTVSAGRDAMSATWMELCGEFQIDTGYANLANIALNVPFGGMTHATYISSLLVAATPTAASNILYNAGQNATVATGTSSSYYFRSLAIPVPRKATTLRWQMTITLATDTGAGSAKSLTLRLREPRLVPVTTPPRLPDYFGLSSGAQFDFWGMT